MKKIITILLVISLMVTNSIISTHAKDYKYYNIQIDSGNGVQNEKAIVDNNEIFISAQSFNKYTRYEYKKKTNTFLVANQKEENAFKKVVINPEKKLLATGTKLIELSNCFVVNDTVYLPLCEMLPILNADIYDIKSNIIYISNNKLSMAEVLYDFDINDYTYNMADEFFDSDAFAKAYILPNYLLDSVINFRFNRLDIFTRSGDYEDYKDILSTYLKEDNLYIKATSKSNSLNELLDVFTGLNKTTEHLYDIFEWIDKLEETKLESFKTDKLVQFIQKYATDNKYTDDFEGIITAVHGDIGKSNVSLADLIDAVDYLNTYFNHIHDHQAMLDAVYDLEHYVWENDPERKAASIIYDLYGDEIVKGLTTTVIEKTSAALLDKALSKTPLSLYKMTAGVAGGLIELYLPGDSGDISQLHLHASIVNSAKNKAVAYRLDTAEQTNNYRLSLLLALIASKNCYQIMLDTAKANGNKYGSYQTKIDQIEEKIMGLYLIGDNVAFDSYEYFDEFSEENKLKIKGSKILENLEVYIPELTKDIAKDKIEICDYWIFLMTEVFDEKDISVNIKDKILISIIFAYENKEYKSRNEQEAFDGIFFISDEIINKYLKKYFKTSLDKSVEEIGRFDSIDGGYLFFAYGGLGGVEGFRQNIKKISKVDNNKYKIVAEFLTDWSEYNEIIDDYEIRTYMNAIVTYELEFDDDFFISNLQLKLL